MSASPQPPPPATVPDPPHTNGSPPASSSGSPAQLADLLARALHETELLRAELSSVKRRADKAERLLTTFQSTAQSPTNTSPPSSSQGASSKPQLSEAARKAIVEFENRAERAEQARDEAEARLRMLQESWVELDRFFAALELRSSDVRSQFARLVADGGGQLVPVTSIPSHNAVFLPAAQQPIQLPPLPASRSHASIRSSHRLNIPSQPFPTVNLPPPPSASSSRVRPRAGSMDAGYGNALTGPGAPPPAKRPRNDREGDDRSRGRRYSLSPSNSPHPAYLSNGHAADRSPHLAAHPSSAVPTLHPHYQTYSHPSSRSRADREDPRYVYPDQQRSRRRGRSNSRGRSSRSRSRSRGSSVSLDEMLMAAAAGDDRAGADPHGHSRVVHPSQHLHPSSRHRSPSPDRSEYHLGVASHHPRARASSSVQLHPNAHATSGQVASPPGPLPAPGQVQTYQTHIFAPPVTGAPVKRSKPGGSALNANGSVLTLGPTGSVISGPSAIGGGGFPPMNTQGQRICRQCGLPGRYKEGKCVEKWGPGPEGPGTVCDRCRKKMKRVERRGTLESQNMAAMHHQPAAIHPSGAPQAAPGSLTNGRMSSSQGADRSVHRSDTIQVHPSQSQSRLGPSGTHILSSSQPNAYSRVDRDREREREHPGSPYHHQSYIQNPRSAQRGPTPPGIATLPNEEDGGYDDHAPRSRGSRDVTRDVAAHKPSAGNVNGRTSGGSSRSASHSPTLNVKGAGTSARASPRGSDGKSKSSDLMDVDADGEEVDADADADADADEGDADADADPEADADAELLEAVDAAEANNATDEEWLKKEDA